MEAVSEHTFKINLDEEDPHVKPLPYSIKRNKNVHNKITLVDYYPKYQLEFYEIVSKCAEYIDRISDVREKLKYHKELSRIFVIRDKPSVMKLFRELVNMRLK